MADRTDKPNSGGWNPPRHKGDTASFPWTKPSNSLTTEQLQALKETDAEVVPENEAIVIGTEPIAAGAWYRPPDTMPEEDAELDLPISDEVIPQGAISAITPQPAIQLPQDLGEFDSSKSSALTGIQPDLGQFDDARSGALAGIQPDLGQFDDERSGQIAGIGAEPEFDEGKSEQLPGIGSDSATQLAEETGVLAEQEPAPALEPDKFADVEAKVTALREQYTAGQITREQLQTELRGLMTLDDQGRWWMLGLETNRWYRYDGRDWVPDEPPRPQQAQAQVQAASQNTPVYGADAAIAAQEAALQQSTSGDSGDVLLPRQVPVDDLEATLVNQSAIDLEANSYAAPTQTGIRLDADGQPEYDGSLDQTLPGGSLDATLPGATYTDPYQQEDPYQVGVPGVQEESEPAYKPKMIGIQPDYSEAFSGYFDRATMTKIAVRSVLIGGVGILLIAFLVVILLTAFYFSVISDYSEAIDSLGDRASGGFETTIIYDADGNQLAQFNDPTTGARKSIPLNEMSPFLIHATITTEDETFYENPGFSLFGIVRATFVNVQTSGGGGGASTITQQLVRALVFDAEFASERSFYRKMQEIFLAAEISRKYTKSEILEFYLNEIYYGNLAYGIEAASETYFAKSASELDIAEAAFLAGLPQAPAVYDPVINPEVAKARMDDVLRLMTEANGTGCIQMEHEPYNTAPFCVEQRQLDEDFIVQIAQVKVRTFQRPQFVATYPHFVNYVMSELEDRYGQSVYGAGFEVYTTLRPEVQQRAQQAILEELPVTQNANNASVVAIRPRDGAVLAMVGSADFDSDGLSDYNGASIDGLVNVAFSPQQPGSSIKPFVYLTAFEGNSDGEYYYPGTIVWDVPTCYPGPPDYCPRNFSNTFSGPVSLRLALDNSLNIPAIKGLAFTGFEDFEATLKRFNIATPLQTPTQAGLSSAIGAFEVRLFDMTRAYATLANSGIQQEPYSIASIINRQGEEIYTANINPEGNAVVSPQVAYIMSNVLSDANSRFAGAQWLDVPGWREAAKTGSTNGPTDVWTMGYTPTVAIGVWVGNTDNSPMGTNVTGSNTAAPIWNKTMQVALAGQNPVDFQNPGGIATFQVCDYTGAIYTQGTCPTGNSLSEIALETQPPPASNNSFLVTLEVDSFSGLLANEHCNEYVEVASFVALDDETAISWLQGQGQGWATSHGIETPIRQAPTQACAPGQPRPQVTVSQPAPNAPVSGLVEVRGQVQVPGFTEYSFYVASVNDPENFVGPLEQPRTTEQPNPNSLLGAPDLSQFANGNYVLRLSVTNDRGATVDVDVPVFVNNVISTPEPIVIPTATEAAPLDEGTGEVGGETQDIAPTAEAGN